MGAGAVRRGAAAAVRRHLHAARHRAVCRGRGPGRLRCEQLIASSALPGMEHLQHCPCFRVTGAGRWCASRTASGTRYRGSEHRWRLLMPLFARGTVKTKYHHYSRWGLSVSGSGAGGRGCPGSTPGSRASTPGWRGRYCSDTCTPAAGHWTMGIFIVIVMSSCQHEIQNSCQ